MRRVLAARVAELLELQTTGRGLLVLGRGVVPVLAIRTLQGNDLAHWTSSLVWPATSADKQHTVNLPTTRRDAGLMGPCCPIPDFLVRDSRAVRHTLVLTHYPRNADSLEVQSLSTRFLFGKCARVLVVAIQREIQISSVQLP